MTHQDEWAGHGVTELSNTRKLILVFMSWPIDKGTHNAERELHPRGYALHGRPKVHKV